MTTEPGERPDTSELSGLLRALVQEARQHTILLAQIVDGLAALQPPPADGQHDASHDQATTRPDGHAPARPHARERQDEHRPHPSPAGRAAPFDVQDLAAVLPEHGGGVHLHTDPAPDTPPTTTVRSGSIVHVLEEREEWVRVATRDGTEGWIRVATLGEV